MLAFDREAYLALIAQYNAAIWPVTTVGLLLGVVILLVFGTKSMIRDRLIGAILALFWFKDHLRNPTLARLAHSELVARLALTGAGSPGARCRCPDPCRLPLATTR